MGFYINVNTTGDDNDWEYSSILHYYVDTFSDIVYK